MPTCISCRDKLLNRMQVVEYTGVNTPLANNPKACYKEDKEVQHLMRINVIYVTRKKSIK